MKRVAPRQAARALDRGALRRLAKETGMVKEAARLLLSTLPELEAKGFDINSASDDIILDALFAVKQNTFAKEALPQVLRHADLPRVGAALPDVLEQMRR